MTSQAILFVFVSLFGECFLDKGVLQEVWPLRNESASASSRSALGHDDEKPTQTGQIDNFDAAAKNGEAFGQRVKGYFLAPQSGEYKFYSSCSGSCDVFLSLTGKGSSTTPDRKSKIISQTQETLHNEFDKYPEQVSHAVYLDKDRSYYIEAVEKQKQGLGLLSVGVVLPDDTKVFPIKGFFLSPSPPADQSEDQASGQSATEKVIPIQKRKYGLAAKRKRDSLYQKLQKINEFIKHLQDEAKNNETSEMDLLKEAEKAEESAAKEDTSGDGTFLDVKGEHFADQDAVEPGINIYVGNGESQADAGKSSGKSTNFAKIDERIFPNDKPKGSSYNNMLSLKTGKPEVDKAEVRMPLSMTNESLASKKSEEQPKPVFKSTTSPASDVMYNSLMNLLKEEIAKTASAKASVNKAEEKLNKSSNATSPSTKASNVTATMVQNILELFKTQQAGSKNGSISGSTLVNLLQGPNKELVASQKDEITKANPVVKMMSSMRPDDLQALFQLNDEINNLRTIMAYKTVKSVRTEKTVRYPDHHEVYFQADHHEKEEPTLIESSLSLSPFSPPLIMKKENAGQSFSEDNVQDTGIRKSINSLRGTQRDLRIHKDNSTASQGGPQIVKVDFSQPEKGKKGKTEEEEHQPPQVEHQMPLGDHQIPPPDHQSQQAPHKLPEQMPERMSERMQEQMPEGMAESAEGHVEEPKKMEEKQEQGEQSQIVPPSAMFGLHESSALGMMPQHPSDEPTPELEHSPHGGVGLHYPEYHEDHHEKGDTVVSQTSVVQETSKLLVGPTPLRNGAIDASKLQSLMNEIGGLRKGVIGKVYNHPNPRPMLYLRGNTPMAATEEVGSKRGIIHSPVPSKRVRVVKRRHKSKRRRNRVARKIKH